MEIGMKKEFLEFLDNLMAAAPNETAKYLNDDAKTYIEALRASSAEEKEKPEMTDNGKLILGYMQTSSITALTSKRVSEGIMISSRGVSGAMRKLVTDGYVEKVGNNPAVYILTEKGKNYKID
jgi:predicted transcriptional regulator